MIDSDFYRICQPMIGRSYNLDGYNCRHLACDFMLEIGIDAYRIFGVGKGENGPQWRESFKALSRSFKRSKTEPEFCLMLVFDASGNHVAIKYKNKVLHNFGRDSNGQVVLTDFLSFKDQSDRIDFYLFPVE